MRTLTLSALLLLALAAFGCSGGSPTATAPAPLDDTNRIGQECPDPGPAPGLPSMAQQGILRNGHGNQIATFLLVSGPFLKTGLDGCDHWFIGANLTVTTLRGVTHEFWSSEYQPLGDGIATFTIDPTVDCPNPTGTVVMRSFGKGGMDGVWSYRDDGCDGAGPHRRARGSFEFVPF